MPVSTTGLGGQLFGRRKKKAEAELPPHLQNGWTLEMLEAAIGKAALGSEPAKSRDYPVKDHTIYLTGFGMAVNKFEVQRMIWGWIDLGIDRATFKRLLVPAYVQIKLAANEEDAAYQYPLDADAVRQLGSGRGESHRGYESAIPSADQPRHVIGLIMFDAREGDTPNARGTEGQRGLLPVFDISLTLTMREWKPVRECIEVGQWRDGRKLAMDIRAEFPESIDIAQLAQKPWGRSFPIVRFWIEAVAALGAGLDLHPIFKSDTESGSISRIF